MDNKTTATDGRIADENSPDVQISVQRKQRRMFVFLVFLVDHLNSTQKLKSVWIFIVGFVKLKLQNHSVTNEQ